LNNWACEYRLPSRRPGGTCPNAARRRNTAHTRHTLVERAQSGEMRRRACHEQRQYAEALPSTTADAGSAREPCVDAEGDRWGLNVRVAWSPRWTDAEQRQMQNKLKCGSFKFQSPTHSGSDANLAAWAVSDPLQKRRPRRPLPCFGTCTAPPAPPPQPPTHPPASPRRRRPSTPPPRPQAPARCPRRARSARASRRVRGFDLVKRRPPMAALGSPQAAARSMGAQPAFRLWQSCAPTTRPML
jgi:hypothetical protein